MTTAGAIVVDASVLVDALTQRDLRDLRQALSTVTLHAPTLVDFEVLSALRGLVLGGHLSEPRGTDALADFGALALRRHATSAGLRADIWALKGQLTAYDAAYVAVAQALDVALWTRDARLARAASGTVEVMIV